MVMIMRDAVFTMAYKIIAMEGEKGFSIIARRKLQKIVYLMQKMGMDFGYRFGWYIYGVYTPFLSEDWINWLSDPKYVELNEKELDVINKLNQMLSEIPNRDYVYWLELLTSLIEVGSKEVLKKMTRRYADIDLDYGWNLLRKYNLIEKHICV